VLIASSVPSDLKGLAKQANELWGHHAAEDLVVAIQQSLLDEEPVAAVRAGGSVLQGNKVTQWKKMGGKNPLPKD
jgi:hypothetical protein